MGTIKTGVIATPEDKAQVIEWANERFATPAMKVGQTWLHESADHDFHARLNALAQKYGLPEPGKDPDGDTIHYGMLDTGEFTTWKPDERTP